MARRLSAVLLIAVILVVVPTVRARDYRFPSLSIEAQLREDGTLHVVETRTASFTGSYSGMYQWINLARGMRITDVQVGEPGRAYQHNPSNRIGPPGTFFAEDRGDELYIDWSFTASDEVRTFVISYVVHNAVLIHDDVAELYYKFVGDRWEKGVDQVVITLSLPEGAGVQDIRAWGHGPLNGIVEIVNGQMVRWTVTSLKAETMVEGRVTFPPGLVTAGQRTGRMGLPGILAEEERWAEEANRQRIRSRVDVAVGIFSAFATFIGAIFMWARYGRAHRPDFTSEYYRELPADYSPAELGVLWNGEVVGSKEFTATLLDLARRGVVKISEERVEKRGIMRRKEKTQYRFTPGEEGGSLKPHEQAVLDLFFEDVQQSLKGKEESEGPGVTLSDVESYARRHRRAFREFWIGWQEDVKRAAAKHNFFESISGMPQVLGFLTGLGSVGLAVAAFIFGWWISGIGLVVAGVVFTILSAVLRRRTVRGSNDYARWKAFRRFLLHFSELPRQEVPALVIWEHYLVYAVTLGVAQQVIKQLEIVFPNLEDGQYRFGYGWYYYGFGTARRGGGLSDLTAALDRSIAQTVQLATSQSSSGSGSGGGFSGGGGGGFGGGGGGAR
ncbi:MAG TPA: DUF2207 domain-containing protein [Firmicutes bacterium]|nr:MAG: hypothetical protein AA931_01310 [Peptococcaceae bacterium 1109]HHT73074.1 DUF2207 domain-containing protein [Bacillota bacterium]